MLARPCCCKLACHEWGVQGPGTRNMRPVETKGGQGMHGWCICVLCASWTGIWTGTSTLLSACRYRPLVEEMRVLYIASKPGRLQACAIASFHRSGAQPGLLATG